jgi:hypothetical protein
MWFDPRTITKIQESPLANPANLLIRGAGKGVASLEISKLAELADPRTVKKQSSPPPEPAEDKPGNHWKITLQSARVIEVVLAPPQARGWVLANWEALDATRLPDIRMMAGPDQ